MLTRFDILLGLLGVIGLTSFWAAGVWDYGYLQLIGGQIAAALLGAFLDRFIHA